MRILIDVMSNQPIYEQIENQIKRLIIEGEVKPMEGLPSIRSLAKDLKISVITIKRAYDDLENAGFIFTQAGKGCFVNSLNSASIQALAKKDIESEIKKICLQAYNSSISVEDVTEMVKNNYPKK